MKQSQNPRKNGRKLSREMITALVGAAATTLAAIITGVFGLLAQSRGQPILPTVSADNTAVVPLTANLKKAVNTLEPSSTYTPKATEIFMPTITPNPVPTFTATPILVPGILFATKITSDGRALDPGTSFPSNISELYAVFPTNMTPPGTLINSQSPVDGAYLAFLKIAPDSTAASIGWIWYLDGKIINQYETNIAPGSEIWLSRYDYNPGGIFRGEPLGPGTYRIVITLGGYPSVSGELTITSNP